MTRSTESTKPVTKIRRILVVDDERTIADTLAQILRLHGYEAAAAYSGESALGQVQEFNPDLVVSDVIMPGMNGAEMAIKLLQSMPTCKILLFSGQAATADLLKEVADKGYDFEIVAKPLHPLELLAKLQEY
jgi:CheY-like chemotaxis protein